MFWIWRNLHSDIKIDTEIAEIRGKPENFHFQEGACPMRGRSENFHFQGGGGLAL